MSNNLSHRSDSYKHLRKFPLNIQMAICLVASVLRRRLVKQEQSDAPDVQNLVKQK
jgi:hypothetical protein